MVMTNPVAAKSEETEDERLAAPPREHLLENLDATLSMRAERCDPAIHRQSAEQGQEDEYQRGNRGEGAASMGPPLPQTTRHQARRAHVGGRGRVKKPGRVKREPPSATRAASLTQRVAVSSTAAACYRRRALNCGPELWYSEVSGRAGITQW